MRGLSLTMAKPDRPIDTLLPGAISAVTRNLKAAIKPAWYTMRKEPNKSVWWITSSAGTTTRLSYHSAIGWLVVSESRRDGLVIDFYVKSIWRTYADRITTRETRCR